MSFIWGPNVKAAMHTLNGQIWFRFSCCNSTSRVLYVNYIHWVAILDALGTLAEDLYVVLLFLLLDLGWSVP